MTLAELIAASPFAKGREAAAQTSANKRKAMLAGVKRRDWRRLKQEPNAIRKARRRIERRQEQKEMQNVTTQN